MRGVIVILTGPSCAGKTTLETALAKLGMGKVVSHTTRLPRSSEINGVDYHFCPPEYFDWLAKEGKLVEQVWFNGNQYGVSADEFKKFLDQGKPVVVVAEPNGRDQIIQYAEQKDIPVLPVFVTNPSNVIAKRFLDRSFGDFAMSTSSGDKMTAAMNTAAKRLDAMLSEEVHWTGADHPEAITLGRFDEGNRDLVIGRIMQIVERLGRQQKQAEAV